MIVLVLLIGSALATFLWVIISEDRDVKKEMQREQKRAEGIEWVNNLINNIKDDELAY